MVIKQNILIQCRPHDRRDVKLDMNMISIFSIPLTPIYTEYCNISRFCVLNKYQQSLFQLKCISYLILHILINPFHNGYIFILTIVFSSIWSGILKLSYKEIINP